MSDDELLFCLGGNDAPCTMHHAPCNMQHASWAYECLLDDGFGMKKSGVFFTKRPGTLRDGDGNSETDIV